MARIIYAHIIRAVYAEIKVGGEDFFFPIYFTRKRHFLWPSAAVRLSVILVQHSAQ